MLKKNKLWKPKKNNWADLFTLTIVAYVWLVNIIWKEEPLLIIFHTCLCNCFPSTKKGSKAVYIYAESRSKIPKNMKLIDPNSPHSFRKQSFGLRWYPQTGSSTPLTEAFRKGTKSWLFPPFFQHTWKSECLCCTLNDSKLVLSYCRSIYCPVSTYALSPIPLPTIRQRGPCSWVWPKDCKLRPWGSI